jgi:hypothetical protein
MHRDINLMPESHRKKAFSFGLKTVKPIVILVLLVAGGLLFYFPHRFVDSMKDRYIGIELKVGQKDYIGDLNKYAEILQGRIEERQRIITSIRSEQVEWSAVITSIASRVPEGIFLSSIECSKGKGVTIKGFSDSYRTISAFISGIQGLDVFAEVLPVRLAVQSQDQLVFSIRCVMKGGNNGTEKQ